MSDPLFMYQLMLAVSLIVSILSGVTTIVNGRRVQKREVSFGSDFVTSRHCDTKSNHIEHRLASVEDSFSAMRAEIHTDRDEFNRTQENRVTALHNRINDVLAAVSRLEGKIENGKK